MLWMHGTIQTQCHLIRIRWKNPPKSIHHPPYHHYHGGNFSNCGSYNIYIFHTTTWYGTADSKCKLTRLSFYNKIHRVIAIIEKWTLQFLCYAIDENALLLLMYLLFLFSLSLVDSVQSYMFFPFYCYLFSFWFQFDGDFYFSLYSRELTLYEFVVCVGHQDFLVDELRRCSSS